MKEPSALIQVLHPSHFKQAILSIRKKTLLYEQQREQGKSLRIALLPALRFHKRPLIFIPGVTGRNLRAQDGVVEFVFPFVPRRPGSECRKASECQKSQYCNSRFHHKSFLTTNCPKARVFALLILVLFHQRGNSTESVEKTKHFGMIVLESGHEAQILHRKIGQIGKYSRDFSRA